MRAEVFGLYASFDEAKNARLVIIDHVEFSWLSARHLNKTYREKIEPALQCRSLFTLGRPRRVRHGPISPCHPLKLSMQCWAVPRSWK